MKTKKIQKFFKTHLRGKIFSVIFVFTDLKKFSPEDLVIINDIDEIPNLENLNIKIKLQFFYKKCFTINLILNIQILNGLEVEFVNLNI